GRSMEAGQTVGTVGGVNPWDRIDPDALAAYKATFRGWNYVGAALVGFWLGLAFLLVLGFGYSFFWTASTIVYLLLRKSVDAAELDEVYLEEDDYEPGFGATPAPTPSPAPAPAPPPPRSLPMVEAPRPTPAPAPP